MKLKQFHEYNISCPYPYLKLSKCLPNQLSHPNVPFGTLQNDCRAGWRVFIIIIQNINMKSKKEDEKSLIPQEIIERKILFFRGKKVILDRDLAVLYGVQTKVLKQAVRRNAKRFPDDFMFELTAKEFDFWRSQFVTSKSDKMGLRYKPMAFTEQGVAMLSSVLNSERAIHVNIQIMRTFTKLREMILTHKELKQKIESMEREYDYQFKIIFDAIKKLLEPPDKPKGKIGFKSNK